ncbi:MAG: Crp/Fnr family transcriptional regulator [Magnetospirillum sp.]|nr:Crp/Fnr family transcriptional regulator [Magnetospirillum sp.]
MEGESLQIPDLCGILDRFGVLAPMSTASRVGLVAAGRVLKLDSGEYAQWEGEQSPGLCCLVRGQLRFSSIDESGGEIIIHIGYAGTWFGQTMFDGPPAVSAIAMVPSEVFVVSENQIRSLIATDPQVALFVIRSLICVSRDVIRRLKGLLTVPSEAVVACLLQQLVDGLPRRAASTPCNCPMRTSPACADCP